MLDYAPVDEHTNAVERAAMATEWIHDGTGGAASLARAQAEAAAERKGNGWGKYSDFSAGHYWEPANPDYRTPPLATIEPHQLHGADVPERLWIVRDWIPDGAVTMLGGDGGVGKSLLAMQLLTAASTG